MLEIDVEGPRPTGPVRYGAFTGRGKLRLGRSFIRRMQMKLFIRSAAALAVLSVAMACNSHEQTSGATVANRSAQTAPVDTNPAASITQDTSVHQGTLESARRISVSELKAEMDKGVVVVVDTRPLATYQASHIKGAISIPYDEFGRRMKELPKGKPIVTYCS